MKVLFALFHKHGVNYYYEKDFNANGDFHGVVLSNWDKAKATEPTFGTFANRAKFDEEADVKLRLSHQKKLFDPFQYVENETIYKELVRVMVFIMGRYFLYRGRVEIAQITWKEVNFGIYSSGPDAGRRYVQMITDEEKMNKRTLKTPAIDLEKRKKKDYSIVS